MNEQQTFLISELHRFVKENGRQPRTLDLLTGNKGNYPTYVTYKNTFNLSFSGILKIAGFKTNMSNKEIEIECEICGDKFITTRTDRNICDSKKCRYIRDMILKSKYNKKKYEFSLFHYIPEDVLKIHYSRLYDNRKEINIIKVI